MFIIGDRVRCIKKYYNVQVGETGTYVKYDDECPEYGIWWDEGSEERHDLGGECPNYHGWYMPAECIALEEQLDLGDMAYADSDISLLFNT